jgi:hypothetical protein
MALALLCGSNLAFFTAQCTIFQLAILISSAPALFFLHRFSFMQ